MTDSKFHADTQDEIAAHFDDVAREYDFWKQKNWLYYDTLRAIARMHAAQDESLLDVGCGTGEMIRAVKPIKAVGIDISPVMVAIAQERNRGYPEYLFKTADITKFKSDEKFKTVLFFDVIEHVPDMQAALRALHDVLATDGVIILSMANPLWEPILLLGEKMGMKMPEGPHFRMSDKDLIRRAAEAGLKLQKREWYLLFPKHLPLVSALLNWFGQFSPLNRLCVIEVFVFRRV